MKKRLFWTLLCAVLCLISSVSAWAEDGFYVIAVGKKLKNLITVAQAGGDFTDPVAAVNSVKNASAANPFLVVIGPGVYTISETLMMKPYVDIVGSGEDVTKLTGTISTDNPGTSAIISGADHSTLSSLTVVNTGGASTNSVAIFTYNASPTLRNVTAEASGASYTFGVCNNSSSPIMTDVTATGSGGDYNNGVMNNSASPIMTNVSATASGGTNMNFGVWNGFSSSPTMTNVTASASGAPNNNHGILNDTSSPEMSNVSAIAFGAATNNLGVTNNSSSPAMTNVTAKAYGGNINSGVGNDGSSPAMTNVIATAFGGANNNNGILNNNSSSPIMTNVIATAYGAPNNNWGVFNSGSSSPSIRRSTMKGDSTGLFSDSGSIMVSQSTIIPGTSGAVGGVGSKNCIACDNGAGAALDASCQ